MPRKESVEAPLSSQWTQPDDIVEYIGKEVPWLVEPVRKALDHKLNDREFSRVREIFQGLLPKLVGFSSELTELYIKTADFQKFLEQTLIRVADERQEEKRLIYCSFLTDAIKSPCDPFEKQLRFLQVVRELRLDQIRLLQVIAAPDATSRHHSLSPIQILGKRLPSILPDRIAGLLEQMNELEIIRLADLKSTAPGHKLADSVTPLGQQLLKLVLPRK